MNDIIFVVKNYNSTSKSVGQNCYTPTTCLGIVVEIASMKSTLRILLHSDFNTMKSASLIFPLPHHWNTSVILRHSRLAGGGAYNYSKSVVIYCLQNETQMQCERAQIIWRVHGCSVDIQEFKLTRILYKSKDDGLHTGW